MVTVQLESFTRGLSELEPLLPIHWEELALAKDDVPLDPNFPAYIAAEERGELIYATLRDDGVLIGYFIAFVNWGLHYQQTLTLKMDICYVVQDGRGKSGGQLLHDCVMDEFNAMRRRKAAKSWSIWLGSKCHKPIAWLWERNGYTLEETYYFKAGS